MVIQSAVRTSTAEQPAFMQRAVIALAAVAVAALAVFVLSTAESGPDSSRLLNTAPDATHVYDGVPRAHPPYLGITNWPLVFQIGSCLVIAGFWIVLITMSRRRGRPHPAMLVLLALWIPGTLLDPLANWAWSFALDPRILHFPVSWPYVSLSPTVQPVVALVGWQWWWLVPGLLASVLHRRFVAPRVLGTGKWLERHPLLTLFAMGFAVGFVWDVVVEFLFIRSGLYTYTQAAGPLLWAGRTWQFPFFWNPASQIFLFGLVPVFLSTDDNGATVGHRLVRRTRVFQSHPRLAEVAVVSGILTLSYLFAIGVFAAMKLTHRTTTLARPWPYQDTKVYDPQGQWKAAGEKAPTYPGIWSFSGE